MVRGKQELDPREAARRAFDALLEAGRYSGYGTTTSITRLGRRAVVAGAEGSRRTGLAWSVLRDKPQPRPRRGARNAAGVVVATAGGIVAALAIRHVFVAWSASDPDAEVTGRLRGALWPAGQATRSATDAAQDPAPRPEGVPDTVTP
jgi:hypothetical protein